jgi:hypothetical protein
MEDEIPERSDRHYAAPEAAERKLLELANVIEAEQGRAPLSEINTQFMAAGGSADEYARRQLPDGQIEFTIRHLPTAD